MAEPEKETTRRGFLKAGLRGACAMCLGGLVAKAGHDAYTEGEGFVWQLDPYKCVQCGKCATACVLAESAACGLYTRSRFKCRVEVLEGLGTE